MLAGLATLLVVFAISAVSTFIAAQRAESAAQGALATVTSQVAAGPSPIAVRPPGLGEDGVLLDVPDLKAADPAEIIRQAGVAVRRHATNCELTYCYLGLARAGVIDTIEPNVLIRWGCRSVDKTKPAGEDVLDQEWDVRIFNGRLRVQSSPSGDHNNPPWSEPVGSFSRIWTAAIESGMPADARVTIYYQMDERSGNHNVWALSVAGHPELNRNIDARTAHVLN